MTIWRMRIACWIPKAANLHIGYEILFFSLPAALTRLRVCLFNYFFASEIRFLSVCNFWDLEQANGHEKARPCVSYVSSAELSLRG